MKNKDFINELKSKKKIKDKNELITIMIYEALYKGFYKFDNKKMIGYTTYRNLLDELRQKYEIPELSKEEETQIEEIVKQRLKEEYNIIVEVKTRRESSQTQTNNTNKETQTYER